MTSVLEVDDTSQNHAVIHPGSQSLKESLIVWGLGIGVTRRAHFDFCMCCRLLMLTILAPKFFCRLEPQVHWALEQLGTRKLLKSHPLPHKPEITF